MVLLKSTLTVLLTVLLCPSLLIAAGAQQESTKCRLEISTPSFDARTCQLEDGETLVVVKTTGAQAVVVKAQFRPGGSADQFAVSKRLWKRLWVESARQALTAREQLAIREAVFLANPSTLDASARSVLDFISNFIEPEERIEELDRTMAPDSLWGFNSIFHYTMICDAIGKTREAHYTGAPGAGLVTAAVMVGEEASRCRGRCGYACEQPFQWRSSQYTQECLDHDVCRDATGGVFGFCKDEFWAAAFGYLVAPDCPSVPQTPNPQPEPQPTPIVIPGIGEPPYP